MIAQSPLALLVIAAVLSASPARAESDANARALAVQLFDQAEALVQKQQFSEACPKYAESFRLDPQLGALIYLAECYEKNGQLASAWGSFREAEEMALKRGDERASHAHERAGALKPRLDYLQISVPKAARVAGLQVLRDGVLVAETSWGNPAPIDAGKHRIEARAPGYKSWQIEVIVSGEASSTEVSMQPLVVDPDAAANATNRADTPGTTQRIAAIATGGVGLVALGVGGFFGLSAQSSYSDSKPLCNESNICTPDGTDLRSKAQSKALVATVATSVGIGALATATLLWFTAPKARAAEPPKSARAPRERRWDIAPHRSAWGVELIGAF
ncbi:MAG TPA: hypothetical protein VFK05_36120 [Polyangiaceae bacterium]|nr:hypothetical protein [Polyangiaceae bacterium]